jgi:murein DD-endopeptidase MepM/ murein hydrolase activator NlpD
MKAFVLLLAFSCPIFGQSIRPRQVEISPDKVEIDKPNIELSDAFHKAAERSMSKSKVSKKLNFSIKVPELSGKLNWVLPKSKTKLSDTYGTRHGRHAGIDAPTPVGTPVYACGTGTVVKSFCDQKNGNLICVETNVNGCVYRVTTIHASRNLVKKGQQVQAGQVIQLSGNKGHSTGPHAHIKVEKKIGDRFKTINPQNAPWDVELQAKRRIPKSTHKRLKKRRR